MTEDQQRCIIALLTASLLCWGLALVYGIVRAWVRRSRSKTAVVRAEKTVLVLSGVLLLSIGLLRYAVGLYQSVVPAGNTPTLLWYEEIVNSLLQTLRMFGADEGYADMITVGRAMMVQIAGENSGWITAFSVYVSLLSAIAPVVGGAIIFELLINIFPKFRLFIYRLLFWKKKYFFSELNAEALALAISILEQKHLPFCRPVIVFSDVSTDEDGERRSELLLRAKSIGAICISDDIIHTIRRHVASEEYLLIDEKEINNIRTFAELAGERYYKYLRRSTVRMFYQDDAYVLTERDIYEQMRARFNSDMRKKYGVDKPQGPCRRQQKAIEKRRRLMAEQQLLADKKASLPEGMLLNAANAVEALCAEIDTDCVMQSFTDDVAPAVIRTRCHQTLIYQLLDEHPLFTPLMDRPQETELELAIIGSGCIGMEMFLSSYWCGQLLGKTLGINMVSLEPHDEIAAKIDHVNTDILKTSQKKNELLSIYEKPPLFAKAYGDPYFTFRYAQADVNLQEIESIECLKTPQHKRGKKLIDCDYYLIAMGSDEANVLAAERLSRALAVSRLNKPNTRKALIAYVICDSHLKSALKNQRKSGHPDVEMVVLGGVEDVYNYNNVFMDRKEEDTVNAVRTYQRLTREELIRRSNDRSKATYDYWSSRARGIHKRYKIFSAYCYRAEHTGSIEPYLEWEKKHAAIWWEEGEELYHLLGWLEHRRWNAYMRSIGCKCREDMGKKHIDLQIHPCIGECVKPGEARVDAPDWLERLSQKDHVAYKMYDYPSVAPDIVTYTIVRKADTTATDEQRSDVPTVYITDKTAAEKQKRSLGHMRRLCKNGAFDGAVKLTACGTWLIPKHAVIPDIQ